MQNCLISNTTTNSCVEMFHTLGTQSKQKISTLITPRSGLPIPSPVSLFLLATPLTIARIVWLARLGYVFLLPVYSRAVDTEEDAIGDRGPGRVLGSTVKAQLVGTDGPQSLEHQGNLMLCGISHRASATD